MSTYQGNELVSQSVILLNARKTMIASGDDKEELAMANTILQTPFSIKQPLGIASNLDDKEANDYILEGAKQLVTLHGFHDCSESAINLLEQYVTAQYSKIILQYKISESRRKEKLETAFKSSAQHVLCSNYITEPVMLQKYVHRKIYPHCIEIVQWWNKYINNPEDRAKLIKQFCPRDDGEEKKQQEEPKRAKKRKRASEVIIPRAISPPTPPATTDTIRPPWVTEKPVILNTSSESSLMTVDYVSGSEPGEGKSAALEEEQSEELPKESQQRKPRKTTKQTKSNIPEEFWERMENAVEGSDHRAMAQAAKPKPKRRPRK